MRRIKYIQEVADTEVSLQHSASVVDKDTGEEFHITSDLHQIAYLVAHNVQPVMTRTRTWQSVSGTKCKVFWVFKSGPQVTAYLSDFAENKGRFRTILEIYDIVRTETKKVSREQQ